MAEKVVGSIVNVAKFRIDSASWKNLDKFQQRLKNLQKQMKAIDGTFTLKAKANQMRAARESSTTSVQRAQKIENLKADAHIYAYRKAQVVKAAMDDKTAKQQGVLKQQANLAELRYIKLQDVARELSARKQIAIDERIGKLRTLAKTHNVDMGAANGLSARFTAARARYAADPTQLGAFRTEVAAIESGLRRIGSGVTRSGLLGAVDSLHSVRLGVAALAATVVGSGIGAFYSLTVQMQNLNAQMYSVSGNQHQAIQDFKWAFAESQRLGTSVKMLGESFSKLSFAGRGIMDTSQVKDLTSSFLELATVAGAGAFQQEKGLYALQNMLGKRKIYSEELFQQMGEQIPMMLLAFEEAIIPKGSKQTLRQYMDEHKGISIDVLPKVAQAMKRIANEGGALENSLQRLEVVQNATLGLFEKNMAELGNLMTPGFKMGLKAFSDFLTTMQPVFKLLAKVLNLMIYGVTFFARVIMITAGELGKLIGKFMDSPTKFFKEMAAGAPQADINKINSQIAAADKKNEKIVVEIMGNVDKMAEWFDIRAKGVFEAQNESMFGNIPFGF